MTKKIVISVIFIHILVIILMLRFVMLLLHGGKLNEVRGPVPGPPPSGVFVWDAGSITRSASHEARR